MKLKLKEGEHIRIQTDGARSLMIYVERGVVHVSAQPAGQPTRVVVADLAAKMETEPNE